MKFIRDLKMKIFVTGGAGCIGSELCKRLLDEGNELVIFDNLSSGKFEYIRSLIEDECKFIEGDVLDKDSLSRSLNGTDIVYHLAANPDIRYRKGDPLDKDFTQNAVGTYNVLESMAKNNVKKIVFSSSSAVLGLPKTFPTPETYGPLNPISLYGASKLSCEGFIAAFCHMLGFQAWIFRFANIVGPKRRKTGTTVITDFINKLRENPNELYILGDGNQNKSFLHVDDCVDGIVTLAKKTNDVLNLINLSSGDSITINRLAEIVIEEMGLKNVNIKYAGGPQGWKGDVTKMLLDTAKAENLGWKAKYNSEQAVREAVKGILNA